MHSNKKIERISWGEGDKSRLGLGFSVILVRRSVFKTDLFFRSSISLSREKEGGRRETDSRFLQAVGAVRFGRFFYRRVFLVCFNAIDLCSCVKRCLARGIFL